MDGTHATSLLSAVTEAGLAGASEPELLRGSASGRHAERVPLARAIVMIDTLHPGPRGPRLPLVRDGDGRGQAGHRIRPHQRGRRRRRELAPQPVLPPPRDRRLDAAPPHRPRRPGRLPDPRGAARARADRLCRADPPLRATASSARWTASTRPGRPTRPAASRTAHVAALRAARPVAGAGDEMRLAGAHRRDAGRDLSRPRRRPARARAAASRAASPTGSTRSSGSATCAASPASPTRRRPSEIIPFLNDYAEAIISAVHEAGGDVLKLIGDGTLAIFTADDPGASLPLRARTPRR